MPNLIKKLLLMFAFLGFFACTSPKMPTSSSEFNILDYGAVADGKTLCTKSIQQAIDAASEAKGKVVVPAGTYLSGTIILKDNVTLELSTGATILGSPNSADYTLIHKTTKRPDWPVHHLVYANGAKNVTICGNGTFDGNGKSFWVPFDTLPRWIAHKEPDTGRRVYSNLAELVNVENLVIKDVLFTNSPEWTLHLFDCSKVFVDGMRIINNLYGPNNDGFDLSGCQDVMISNCYIETCDDAVCIKTFPHSRISKNIVVTNCVMVTTCAAFKFGETYRDIRDITFSNSVIYNSSRAIGIYATLGGTLENLAISNIVCNTNAPLVLNRPIQIGAWNKIDVKGNIIEKGGNIRNITIDNFISTTEGRILITADDGLKVENVSLTNIQLTYPYIEDAVPYANGATSNQIAGIDMAARAANAAIVGHNLTNFVVKDVIVNWPDRPLADEWKHPERIENGSERVHKPDYSKPGPEAFDVVFLNNVQGGLIDIPLAKAYGSGKVINSINSKVLVR